MDNFTIAIFGSKIFLDIINELKLFSNFKIKYYKNLDLCVKDAEKETQLVVFFVNESNKNFFNKIKINNCPLILVAESSILENKFSGDLVEQLTIPFSILDFKKKIVVLIAKNKFKQNSLIHLRSYVIDKNERKIKKNNLELQLSEKEISCLILFSKGKKPINRSFLLKNVWNYSTASETHTVETHIHRLRKKILEKFGDSDFIKNNNQGYYI